MPITIRPARRDDVPALVRLRLANAEQHVQLEPALYRRPDPGLVRSHFEQVLAPGRDPLILVAETGGAAGNGGEVAGMAEVVTLADPPDHQILIPRRAAEIHTVVLDRYRGQGIGRALVGAAERAAAGQGVVFLYAGILTRNADAVRFYTAAGFGPRGTLLSKNLTGPASTQP